MSSKHEMEVAAGHIAESIKESLGSDYAIMIATWMTDDGEMILSSGSDGITVRDFIRVTARCAVLMLNRGDLRNVPPAALDALKRLADIESMTDLRNRDLH